MTKPRKFSIPTIKVRDIDVRGLSLNDVATLGVKFGPAMGELFKEASLQGGMSREAVTAVTRRAASDFPDLIGIVIALATGGDEQDAADANNLPMGHQIEYLEAVFDATFRSDSDIVKMVESLSNMLEKVTRAMDAAPSSDTAIGIGTSDAK